MIIMTFLFNEACCIYQEGVLTIEGAGHLGTIMTQYSILYALSRRDSKYAFIPPEIEMPMKQAFLNIRNN